MINSCRMASVSFGETLEEENLESISEHDFGESRRQLAAEKVGCNLGVSGPSGRQAPPIAFQRQGATRDHSEGFRCNLMSPKPRSTYPPLPPHYTPPPRRRVSFCSDVPEENETYVTASSGSSVVPSDHIDPYTIGNILAKEHRSYCEMDDHILTRPSTAGTNCNGSSAVEEHQGCHQFDVSGDEDDNVNALDTDEDDRMRGGCGGCGGGGSGGCCGGVTGNGYGSGTGGCGCGGGGGGCGSGGGGCGGGGGGCGGGGGGCGGGGGRNMLGGSGGCCGSSAGTARVHFQSDLSDGGCCGKRAGGCRDPGEASEGACASTGCGNPRNTGYETCPPREPDPCKRDDTSPCSTVACSPPCAGRKGCCPPAGCRPVCRKKRRCTPPCTAESKSCGGGGCCGSGCRGGCGKPGQVCMPLRPCNTPPCLPHPCVGGSPCSPPRPCAPQPPCCRSPQIPGTPASMSGMSGGEGSSCRSRSPGGRTAGGGGCCDPRQDDGGGGGRCCAPKLPPGCECLGGGLDCQRCGRKVYQAEMQIVSGVPYHNICFSCFCCRKPLEPLTYQENCGEIYCKQCYVRNFGPQGYGYGAGAGVLQTPM